MRRFGEAINWERKYRTRVGVYGIIKVGNDILLTEEDGDEILLPGGGVDQNEHMTHALVRECYEETGWKVLPVRRLGAYQRFVFMPEYNLWAHKICSVYIADGAYPISEPTEKEHVPFITEPETAVKILHSPADRSFVQKYFQI